jgi:hypothetical protein
MKKQMLLKKGKLKETSYWVIWDRVCLFVLELLMEPSVSLHYNGFAMQTKPLTILPNDCTNFFQHFIVVWYASLLFFFSQTSAS